MQKLSIQAKFEVLNIASEKLRSLNSGTVSNCAATRTTIKNLLGTGGSPASVYRAAQLEVPMFLGILGGTPEHWGQYCHAYRDALLKAGHSVDAADLAVAVHGFVGRQRSGSEEDILEHEIKMFQTGSAECYCNCCFFIYI